MPTTVQDLMTAPARTVRTDDTLYLAAEAMWEGDCGGVPVVDIEGRLAGFVTDRDIAMCAAIQGRTLHELKVTAAMSFDAASVTSRQSVAAAHDLLRARQVRRLPVVDEQGAVVGVLSLADLVRDAEAHPSARARRQDVRATVAAVAAPRDQAPAGTSAADAVGGGATAGSEQAAKKPATRSKAATGKTAPRKPRTKTSARKQARGKATGKPAAKPRPAGSKSAKKAVKATKAKAVKKAVKPAHAKAVKKAVKSARAKAVKKTVKSARAKGATRAIKRAGSTRTGRQAAGGGRTRRSTKASSAASRR